MSTDRFELAPFRTLIQQRCGLVFGSGNDEKLESALSGRMKQLAMGPPSIVAGRYLTRLRADAEEFQTLVNLLTINETFFFREPEQITLLVDHLLPRLLAEKSPTEPLRLLSAGCASGEEAYSLSIAIAERHGDYIHSRCQIVGVDIDSEIITKARRGVYSGFSFRGLDAEFRERYFQPGSEVSTYRIQEKYRRRVSFFQANLFAETPFDIPAENTIETAFSGATPRFDIALMRNVSIYFDEEGRHQLQRALHRQLSSKGQLVVGSAETLANDLGIFRLVESAGHYYFTKEAQALPTEAVSAPPQAVSAAAPIEIVTLPSEPSEPSADSASTWQDISQLLESHKHQEAGLILASLRPSQSQMHPFKVLMAYLALEEDRLDEAKEITQRLLLDQPWFVDALFVQGLVAKLQQRTEDAAACFRRVIYTRPACWPALFHLAECGEPHLGREQRLRAYRNALRLSESDEATGIDYLPIVQQRTQIRQLARQRLVQLADANFGGAEHGH